MAASETKKQVEIGDRLVNVSRFSTFKAIHAGELLTEVLNEVPDLSEKLSAYNAEFRSKNTVRISRAAAELRYDPEQLAQVSEEAWMATDGYMELPASPGALDVAAFVLPVAFEAARDRVLELLALVVVSNSELRDADEANNIGEVLDAQKKLLLHSDLGELIDLVVAAVEVLTEQFEGKAGSSGVWRRSSGSRSGRARSRFRAPARRRRRRRPRPRSRLRPPIRTGLRMDRPRHPPRNEPRPRPSAPRPTEPGGRGRDERGDGRAVHRRRARSGGGDASPRDERGHAPGEVSDGRGDGAEAQLIAAGIAVTFTEEAAILVESTLKLGDDEHLISVAVVDPEEEEP
jgi:hypothetical protein